MVALSSSMFYAIRNPFGPDPSLDVNLSIELSSLGRRYFHDLEMEKIKAGRAKYQGTIITLQDMMRTYAFVSLSASLGPGIAISVYECVLIYSILSPA
jgi:hypothetical protein